MKISFNETSLQTMFEYPSESSLAEEDEEEEGHASETEEEKPRTFYIPRPNGTLHPSTANSGESGTVLAPWGFCWCLGLHMGGNADGVNRELQLPGCPCWDPNPHLFLMW